MSKYFLIILSFGILLQSCEGPQGPTGLQGLPGTDGLQGPPGVDGKSDKQIRIQLHPGYSFGNNSKPVEIGVASQGIIMFNIDNYVDVDSVVLVGLLYSEDTTASCILGLYNLTDSTYLNHSEIESHGERYIWITSSNCYTDFPHKEITLVPYCKSGKNGALVLSFATYLFLYRK